MPEPEDLLLSAQFLTRRGVRPQREAATAASRITRVRRGVYAANEHWSALQEAERYRMLVIATVACMRSVHPIFCGLSAAVLWRLPIIGRWPTTVETINAGGGAGSSGLIVRRRVAVVPEPREVSGLLVTSPARTVVDVARNGDFAAGLTAADAVLRMGLCTVEDLDAELARLAPRARGRAVAANVVRLADSRAESPGESLSRARMWELGLPQPQLQTPLKDELGEFGRGDFGWDGVIGEFDGRLKYRLDGVATEVAEDVLWREKQREDRIRRTAIVARWTWDDALRTQPMARILAAAGVRPEQRRKADVDSRAHEWRRPAGATQL